MGASTRSQLCCEPLGEQSLVFQCGSAVMFRIDPCRFLLTPSEMLVGSTTRKFSVFDKSCDVNAGSRAILASQDQAH